MLNQTALYELHLSLKGHMVDFAGYSLPLHYGSQLEEHHTVRQDAGMFDVSHMGIIDIKGFDARKFLRYVLANNIDKISEGKALYTCLLNFDGGVLDDLIVYCMDANFFRLVVNAKTKIKDLEWLISQKDDYGVEITPFENYAIIAIQGPKAIEKTILTFPQFEQNILNLKPFQFTIMSHWFIARTGYTGEDGLEMIVPSKDAVFIFKSLLEKGVRPIGLGARDTLRLEAGFNLYGQDMDETVTPLVSNLAFTVAFEPESRNFIGREALLRQKEQGLKQGLEEGLPQKLVGLIGLEKGILRGQQSVWAGERVVGKITSGGFSPTLSKSIGLARIDSNVNNECYVEIRNKKIKAKIVKPPFVRRDH